MLTYLEMSEVKPDPLDTVGVSLRVIVADRDAALLLRDELAARFFAGLTHTAKLHLHVPGGSCTTEDL